MQDGEERETNLHKSLSINNRKKLSDTIRAIRSDSCPKEVNLHIHSTFSDGSLTPTEIYNQAIELDIKNFAITDHHTIKAYLEIEKLMIKNSKSISIDQPNFWTGIEITCLLKGCLVHVLGLGFDSKSPYLDKYTTNRSAIGTDLLASTVVNCIHKANGVAILAHPARYKISFQPLINEASNLKFDGVETWYNYERSSTWKPSELICESIYKQANLLDLSSTCGTDTHGISLLRR